MAELWRTVLFPVFCRQRYPGSYFRLLEGIAAIQRGRHQDAYLGAYRLSQLTGQDVSDVKKMLKRLVADDVLQVVEPGQRGRYKADEKHGAPGRAAKYALGRLTYPQDVHSEEKGVISPPIERGSFHPLTTPRKGVISPPIERGSFHPHNSSVGSYDPPSSEEDAMRVPAPALTVRADGLRPASDTLPAVMQRLTARSAGESGSADLDAELRSRVAARRRR